MEPGWSNFTKFTKTNRIQINEQTSIEQITLIVPFDSFDWS